MLNEKCPCFRILCLKQGKITGAANNTYCWLKVRTESL